MYRAAKHRVVFDNERIQHGNLLRSWPDHSEIGAALRDAYTGFAGISPACAL
jgi:hypothetical protein